MKELFCYYKNNLARYSEEHKILGWESKESQLVRFKVFDELVDVSGKSILDVGCGLGGLYSYLKSRGYKFRYTGIDILPEMVTKAGSLYPEADFICRDIMDINPDNFGQFDVVFSSGIFNLNMGNNSGIFQESVKIFMHLSRETVCFNMLHRDSLDREQEYFYSHPGEVKESLKKYYSCIESVEFRDNYLPNDFTIVIHKKTALCTCKLKNKIKK